jgi:hypothetical protein
MRRPRAAQRSLELHDMTGIVWGCLPPLFTKTTRTKKRKNREMIKTTGDFKVATPSFDEEKGKPHFEKKERRNNLSDKYFIHIEPTRLL